MIITNDLGLSEAWVRALSADDYDKVGDYSSSTLANPPRIHFLTERHDDEIVEDVCNNVWKLLGNACHYILEKAAEEDAITEQRFTMMIEDRETSLKPDRIEPIKDTQDYHLKDFKITTVWKAIIGCSDEWERQLNTYAYGARKQLGINVTKITIEMLLKDWRMIEYKNKKIGSIPAPNYPDFALHTLPVRVWSDQECEEYLRERVNLFKMCEDLPDDDLPCCTEKERWAKPTTYAVKSYKADGEISKNAMKGGTGFGSYELAKEFADKQKCRCYIEPRPGKSTRCEDYCPVAPFCNCADIPGKEEF